MALTVAGCGESDRPPFEETDDGSEAWTIGDTPTVSMTGVEGTEGTSDTTFFFGLLRATFSADSLIAAAVTGNRENRIVILEADGTPVANVGGRGEGPGEFQSISGLFSFRDGVAVWDARSRRLTTYDARGNIVAQDRMTVPAWQVPVGVLGDRRLITTELASRAEAGEARVYHLWGADGQHSRVEGPVETTDGSLSFGPLSFSQCLPRLHGAVTGETLFVADARAGEILSWGPERGFSLVHSSEGWSIVTEQMADGMRELVEFAVDRYRGALPGPGGLRQSGVEIPRGVADSVLRVLGAPGDTLGVVWDDLVVDEASGHLWLRRATCFPPEGFRQKWEVISLDGEQIAEVEMPGALEILDASARRVLSRVRDEYGVERLEIYEVHTEAGRTARESRAPR